MRKAQIIGQIFVFVLAALVFILILFYGYRAISGFLQTKEQVEIIDFKTELESSIRAIRTSYGSVRKAQFLLPPKYLEFCAVDPSMSPAHANTFSREHPLMHNIWLNDPSNTVFLRPLLETSLNVPHISVKGPIHDEPGYFCTPIINGNLIIGLRGQGDSAQIIAWENQ